MTSAVPRLRMFAGPNGSGKSTIKSVLPAETLGIYINPDEIEVTITSTHRLDLAKYGVTATTDEIRNFFACSTLLQYAGLAD